MALNHFKAKLFSGLQHFFSVHFAGVQVEIVVRPSGGGGGWVPDLGPSYIKITVTHKDKKWVLEKEQSYLGSIGLIVVKAYLARVDVVKAQVSAILDSINKVVESITIKAKKK